MKLLGRKGCSKKLKGDLTDRATSSNTTEVNRNAPQPENKVNSEETGNHSTRPNKEGCKAGENEGAKLDSNENDEFPKELETVANSLDMSVEVDETESDF